MGGAVGSSVYLLGRAGRTVIVLDDGAIGGGETGRTTAHLSDALDDRYRALERLHGADGARHAAASHRAAIDRIAAIVSEESIDCDFAYVDGYLFPSQQHDATELRAEHAAAQRAGASVDLVDDTPAQPFGTQPALRFRRQARFHPLRYLAGLARCIERDGGRIFTGTHVMGVQGGTPVRIEAENGARVDASACVIATNAPITDRVVTHAKQAPYRTFAVAAPVPRGGIPDALFWDDADPYTYIRLHPDREHDWLIVGGLDYRTGQSDDDTARLDRLETWLLRTFPAAQPAEYRWSGQVLEPADGVAFIGPNPDGAENVCIITGDSGQGMTHGTIGAILLTDRITGAHNEWSTLYDPHRGTLRAVGDLARENLNVAAQYADWLAGDSDDDVVPPGKGRVIRRGARMIAVYCDEQGNRHERSAACTHLKCVVHWNDLEKSWDCPCHGSRFTPTGDVLNGPAVSGLEEV